MSEVDEHKDADDIYDQCDNNDIDEATEYEYEDDDIGDNEAHEHDDIGDNETHDDTGGAIKYDQKMLMITKTTKLILVIKMKQGKMNMIIIMMI